MKTQDDIKWEYKQETGDNSVFCNPKQPKGLVYKDEYVQWLEMRLVNEDNKSTSRTCYSCKYCLFENKKPLYEQFMCLGVLDYFYIANPHNHTCENGRWEE